MSDSPKLSAMGGGYERFSEVISAGQMIWAVLWSYQRWTEDMSGSSKLSALDRRYERISSYQRWTEDMGGSPKLSALDRRYERISQVISAGQKI